MPPLTNQNSVRIDQIRVGAGGGFDPNAQDYINVLVANGWTFDNTLAQGINRRFLDMKGVHNPAYPTINLYSKYHDMKIYQYGLPILNKWNALDPRDLDVALRATFSPLGLTHGAHGITGDGIQGFINSHYRPDQWVTQDNKGFTVYNFDTGVNNGCNTGGVNASFQGDYLAFDFVGTGMYHILSNSTASVPVFATKKGACGLNRLSSTTLDVTKNQVTQSLSKVSANNMHEEMYDLARNYNDTIVQWFCDDTISYVDRHDGFTPTEEEFNQQSVNALMTVFGSNTY